MVGMATVYLEFLRVLGQGAICLALSLANLFISRYQEAFTY